MANDTRLDAELLPAATIPSLPPAESLDLERAGLHALIALLEALPPEAWTQPVARAGWDVHALVAHIAGRYAAQASMTELRRQATPRLVRFYRMEGESIADTVARIQIGDRRHRQPWQLIDELRRVGPEAIDRRARLFRPLNVLERTPAGNLRLPAVPLGPFRSVRELWFQRFEIAEASGRPFMLDDAADRRVVDELVRRQADSAERALGERAVGFAVTGVGQWAFGGIDERSAAIELEPRVLAFLLSGRRTAAWVRERSVVEGDVRIAMSLLRALHPAGA